MQNAQILLNAARASILPSVNLSNESSISVRENAADLLRGLYVVTDARAFGGHVAMTRAALEGGARVIQLREKTLNNAQLLPIAREIRALTRRHNALFLLNDRADFVRDCEADGVHLGPDDLPIRDARRLLPNAILGASCGDIGEAQRAQNDGADYIGAGAVFGTQTKSDAGAPIGLETLAQIVRATSLPVAAIGGVKRENLSEVLRAGAKMACVVSALSAAPDEISMREATRELTQIIDEFKREFQT